MKPPSLIATFTLFSDYPLQWVLTLINEPLRRDVDISNGLPPGLLVAPPGGHWDSPNLTVTVTMTSAYMASLEVGKHHFFMTGVNQRGLNGFAQIELRVS